MLTCGLVTVVFKQRVNTRHEFTYISLNTFMEIALISTMGFLILVRWHLYIESGPWYFVEYKVIGGIYTFLLGNCGEYVLYDIQKKPPGNCIWLPSVEGDIIYLQTQCFSVTKSVWHVPLFYLFIFSVLFCTCLLCNFVVTVINKETKLLLLLHITEN